MSASHSDTFDQLAHRAARRKLGWYIHALAYVCVNLALLAISFSHGRHWALFPLFGWGLGLLIHGLVVFVAAPGGALYTWLLDRERAALVRRHAAERR